VHSACASSLFSATFVPKIFHPDKRVESLLQAPAVADAAGRHANRLLLLLFFFLVVVRNFIEN
jgi:hypothetical protein